MKLDFLPAAILFDMDGLMIDSESAVLDCWRLASLDHGVHFDDSLLMSMVGLHEKLCHAILRQRFPELDIDAIALATDKRYSARVEQGLPLKAGILPLLGWLDELGLPKAVATSTRRERAEQKLRQTGLIRHFQVVVTGSDVEHPKPAPDIYLLAARRLGVEPARCLVLEDSEPGVRAALAAGMTPIQIPDLSKPSAEVVALGHRILSSLDDAHALLREVLGRDKP
ncbi:HAD family phosphatase [Chitinimonas arctica]|uniref:HAD family phosphatase n=1 Tax=Chitinimonas arctica TaxID=2594795 RepID=A0A516SLA0_9NEIS|nr:HAD family phosphatase [Chitinimonas arctica]QDQ28932.1 HAD family phosphatase [Chitinimonas arctica]